MRHLNDLKIDKGNTVNWVSAEGIEFIITNRSAGWAHIRLCRIFKRGRKAAGQKPAAPKENDGPKPNVEVV